MPRATKRPSRQYAGVTLQGQLVERAQVLTQGTEWPKVGAPMMVQHGPDQQTIFNLVAVGPMADRMLDAPLGKIFLVTGQLKAATGRIEVFVNDFTVPQTMPMGYRSIFGFGQPPVDGEDWKQEGDSE